jgi:hypothetical protein
LLLASIFLQCIVIVTLFNISAEDKGIGTILPSKIIIIISQALAWGQLLLVPLDLGVSGSSAMQTVYSIVYILIFVFSVFIMPFISALYESDEEDSLLKRILYSAAYAFAITAVWCAVVFISFIWLSKYTTPSGA